MIARCSVILKTTAFMQHCMYHQPLFILFDTLFFLMQIDPVEESLLISRPPVDHIDGAAEVEYKLLQGCSQRRKVGLRITSYKNL